MFPVLVNILAALVKLVADGLHFRKEKVKLKNAIEHHYSQNTYHQQVLDPEIGLSGDGEAPPELPLVYVYIPVYNEPLPNLLGAIQGIISNDYPRLRLYVAFDNFEVQDTFFTLIRILRGVPILTETLERKYNTKVPSLNTHDSEITIIENHHEVSKQKNSESLVNSIAKVEKYNGLHQLFHDGSTQSNSGSNSSATGSASFDSLGSFTVENCPKELSVVCQGVPVKVMRFPHSGKLGTQRNMFERMKLELHDERSTEQPHVLFVDSDTALMKDTISCLVSELSRNKKAKACTGFVVSRNQDSYNFLRVFQDAEYIESMLFRNAEALLGAVTCLPGVLTLFKLETLLEVAETYFYQKEIASTYDFCRRYLGEDRYMTHILMEKYGNYALGFNSHAVCKTLAPSNFIDLLRQRRRWLLGTVTNDVVMICTIRFWIKFPLLMITRFCQLLKVGGAVTYMLLLQAAFQIVTGDGMLAWRYILWFLMILLPNWVFVTIWALWQKRYKACLMFPLHYFFNPLFMVIILLYSFATFQQRTWGGPRTAAKSEEGEVEPKEGSAS
jgi:cellulose synthase/poly-beta-1,6-N-acetylglucosamine synthase-like glycosyltransferase